MENVKNTLMIKLYHLEDEDAVLTDTLDKSVGVICINHYCFPIDVWESMTQEEKESYSAQPVIGKISLYRKKKKLKVYKIKKR